MPNQERLRETKHHGAVRFPFNIYPCTIPGDFLQVPLHWHDSMELVYVKKGSGIVQVGVNAYPAEQGDIYIFAPGTLHALHQRGQAVMEYENIIFDMQMLIPKEGDTMSFNFFHRLQNFPEDFPVLIDRVPKAHRAVQICLDRIDDLRTTYPAGYYLGIKG